MSHDNVFILVVIYLSSGHIYPYMYPYLSSGHNAVLCHPNELRCGSSNQCVALSKFCDGKPDCSNGEDEGPFCSEYEHEHNTTNFTFANCRRLRRGKVVERLEVRGRKRRGRPKKRWKDCVNQDLSEKNSTGHEAHIRAAWKVLTRNADPNFSSSFPVFRWGRHFSSASQSAFE
jgi:Low-density lipoprotein receptor domain class A.